MWQRIEDLWHTGRETSLRRMGTAVGALGLVALTVGVVPTVAAASRPHGSAPHMTWRLGARIRFSHLEGAAVAVGKNVFDISGSTRDCSDGVTAGSTPRVDIYNTVTNAFGAGGAPIPNPRQGGPAAVVVGHMIYVIGGITNCTPGNVTVTNVDMYNTVTNVWNAFGGGN